jgi:hypothetical protein
MNISLKTKVKYWFYFLRLCHKINDPVIQLNLKKSKSLYKRWGDYQSGSYENWWKEHSHLFSRKDSIEKFYGNEPIEKDSLYIKIPYRYSPSTVSKIVLRMYKEEHDKRIVKDGKVKKVYDGVFQLSTTDIQTSQFDYYLRFTRDVYIELMNQGVIGTQKYRILSEKVFKKQKLKSSRKKDEVKRQIPFVGTSQTVENLDRLTRRYKTYSKNILMNVSQGMFPGDYEEVGIKNQVEKRKVEYKIRKFSKGPSKTRIHKKSGLVQNALWIDERSRGN